MDDKVCGEKDKAIILCGLWSIWRSRNDRLHGKAPIGMKEAIDWALDVCFHLISVKAPNSPNTTTRVNKPWRLPPSGVPVKGSGSVGVVARDSEGDFLMAMTRRLAGVALPLAAEAIDGHLARPAQRSPARRGPGTKRPSPTRPDGLRARVVLALWAELGAQH
jgi:hypothetical protein